MSLEVASLGSGSKGNATLVRSRSTTLMIDCGYNRKTALARAEAIGLSLSDLDAILVTHEHSDHIGGVSTLARSLDIPVYTTVGTWHAKSQHADVNTQFICSHTPFKIGDIDVCPVAVPHDSKEPVQFVFESGQARLGILTDLGSISPHVREVMSDLDGLLIEFNHCSDRLRFGPYPPRLKQRVGSDYGHLNNQQALEFVQQLNLQRLQLLIAAHISEQNNCPKLVDELLTPYRVHVSTLMIAEQAKGYNWIPVIPD
jgi:phosphoribosyl 1,2-cyclic phosphodiesterase